MSATSASRCATGWNSPSTCIGPRAKGACDIRRSPTENLHALSEALGRPVRDLTAVILDRPRHDTLIAEVERPLIRLTLAATRGNQIKAASMLGLNRNTLRKKIRDLEIPVVRGLM